MESIIPPYYGSCGQDQFALGILKNKKNGVFLELGASHGRNHNNTYTLETFFDWKGLMIEMNPKYIDTYKEYRKNSHYIINQAINIDYIKALEELNFPQDIDFLQIDLEPRNGSTTDIIKHFHNTGVFDKYKFATVCFETDIYDVNNFNLFNVAEISREIFNKHGYVRVFTNVSNFEDWYCHPDLVDIDYINSIKTDEQLSWEQIITKIKGSYEMKTLAP